MKITPLDIRQKTFENKFRGYDKDEVHAFLNSLSHEWERVQDEYKEMKIRYEGIQGEVEKLRQVESSLYKTLKTAEDTGASLVEQANRSAELHMKEAQMKADDTIKAANEKSKYIVENAEKISKTILEEMKDAIKNVESDFRRLESAKEDLLQELKNLSNETLDKVEKYKNQKNAFDFDDHLKKAKSFARLRKDHSYYTFNPETENSEAGPAQEPERPGKIPEEENKASNQEESDREQLPFTPDPVHQEVEHDEEIKTKKQNRSFFDEIE